MSMASLLGKNGEVSRAAGVVIEGAVSQVYIKVNVEYYPENAAFLSRTLISLPSDWSVLLSTFLLYTYIIYTYTHNTYSAHTVL